MKKRLFALVMALCLVLTSTIPAFAANNVADDMPMLFEVSDSDVSGSDIVVDVNAIYVAFTAMVQALEGDDLGAVRSALDDFVALVDMINEMSDEDYEDLAVLLECEPDDALYVLLGDYVNAYILVETADILDAYKEDPSFENSVALIDQYLGIFYDPDYVDEELMAIVRKFLPDIDEVANDAAEPRSIRLAGETRTETAAAISGMTYDESYCVFLASGDDYADALAGAPLAYIYGAPILLVRNSTLDEATLAEIERLGATDIYILGGKAAIGAEVYEYFSERDYYVERIAGETRFETAQIIAETLFMYMGEFEEVFFSYSHGYADALAISSVAATKYCPILYLPANGEVSEDLARFISDSDVKHATILGGSVAVSEDAEENLEDAGIDYVRRLEGDTRYETCIEINREYDDILTGYSICIATGKDYPDALAGGVFAASKAAPLLLVGDSLNDAQKEYLMKRHAVHTYIFGGVNAVSDELVEDIMAASTATPDPIM